MSDEDKKIGLYKKYYVSRVDGRDKRGEKHYDCDYFVLDLFHDPHAAPALLAYIASCRDEYPKLAEDLEAEAIRIMLS